MTDQSAISRGIARRAPAESMSLEPCPPWCERPAGHHWEDDVGDGVQMRLHWRVFPIPGTDHGTVMMSAAEYLRIGGTQSDPPDFIIDTGVVGDGEINADGARGLNHVLAEALELMAEHADSETDEHARRSGLPDTNRRSHCAQICSEREIFGRASRGSAVHEEGEQPPYRIESMRRDR